MQQVIHNKQLLAIIIPASFREEGVHFFTEPEMSQQMAYMRRPSGSKITAHSHKQVNREVRFSQEVLFIKRGVLRVDFYDDDHDYVESRVLNAGDVILLAGGGHGFQVLEEVEMIEIKQGPFASGDDKVVFDNVDDKKVKIVK